MSLTKTKLSLAEKLDFLPALATIFVAATYSLLTGLWRTERQAKSLLLHFGYAIFRQATARLSPAQMQAILPPSNKIYERYVKKVGVKPQSVDLGHGALGHWVGDRDATNVLIWFHGKQSIQNVQLTSTSKPTNILPLLSTRRRLRSPRKHGLLQILRPSHRRPPTRR